MSPRPERLLSVDVFRGLTIALMILVNNPGSWAHILPPLRHAHWHGLTPTDLVFPFFLFIVGVAVALSLDRRLEAGAERRDLVRKVVVRTVLIFLCGLLLNGYPFGLPLSAEAAATFGRGSIAAAFADLRIMGVLQRIALCYLAVGLLAVLARRRRTRVLVGAGCLVVYELAMRLPLVAGWRGFALETNPARWLDLQVFGAAHLWGGAGLPFDPEGLLSTLPAVATTLAGYFTGRYLRWPLPPALRARTLAVLGVAVTAAGAVTALGEPINKQLWTVSYVVVTAGLALLALAASLWVVDVRGWTAGAKPFIVFGSNPLVVFVGSGVLARTLSLLHTPGGTSVQRWLYTRIFQPLAGDTGGSLLQALCHVLLWLAALWVLYRRRIFIRI